MPSKTPNGALAAFLARLRRAIQCVAVAEVRGSGSTTDRTNDVTLIPRDGAPGNIVPLRTTDGRRNLRFGVYLRYRIQHVPDAVADERFGVEVLRYVFELRDREAREIVAYHWHPTGVSPIRFPHLHFPSVALIPLSEVSPRVPTSEIEIGKAHFPTGRITLEDVVGLLIRDFAIEPRRSDWSDVLGDGLSEP